MLIELITLHKSKISVRRNSKIAFVREIKAIYSMKAKWYCILIKAFKAFDPLFVLAKTSFSLSEI